MRGPWEPEGTRHGAGRGRTNFEPTNLSTTILSRLFVCSLYTVFPRCSCNPERLYLFFYLRAQNFARVCYTVPFIQAGVVFTSATVLTLRPACGASATRSLRNPGWQSLTQVLRVTFSRAAVWKLVKAYAMSGV